MKRIHINRAVGVAMLSVIVVAPTTAATAQVRHTDLADRQVPIGEGVTISPLDDATVKTGRVVTVTYNDVTVAIQAFKAGAGKDPGEVLQQYLDLYAGDFAALTTAPVQTWLGPVFGHDNVRHSASVVTFTRKSGQEMRGRIDLFARADGLVVIADEYSDAYTPFEDSIAKQHTDVLPPVEEDIYGIRATVDSLATAPPSARRHRGGPRSTSR